MIKDNSISEVAVITRTKDRPLLLERAILSVMKQTLKDFILVIVNDGGDSALIEKLISKHQNLIGGRVKVINNPKSLGMQAAANVGIKQSNSLYVAIHDDDDSWEKDFLEETTKYLKSADHEGVVTATYVIDEEVKDKAIHALNKEVLNPTITDINYFNLLGINQFPPIAFLYKREVLDKIGYYSEDADVLGDWDFNIRFMRHHDIGFIGKPLANYHRRSSSGGPLGNSIFEKNRHEKLTAYLLNKYLRSDLEKNILGTGFISNISNHLHTMSQEALSRSEFETILKSALDQTEKIVYLQEEILKKDQELRKVYGSRSWKLVRQIQKIFSLLKKPFTKTINE